MRIARRMFLCAGPAMLAACAARPAPEDAGDGARVLPRDDGPAPATGRVRFDGIYVGPWRYSHGAWVRTCLRVFDDGHVVMLPSARPLEDVVDRMSQAGIAPDAAPARIDGPRIAFVLDPDDEAIAYEGLATVEGMVLSTRKPHTGLRHAQRLRFVALAPRVPRAPFAQG